MLPLAIIEKAVKKAVDCVNVTYATCAPASINFGDN